MRKVELTEDIREEFFLFVEEKPETDITDLIEFSRLYGVMFSYTFFIRTRKLINLN